MEKPDGLSQSAENAALSVETDESTPPDKIVYIDDWRFRRNLHQLMSLHSFLLKEAIKLPSGFTLGELNLIYYRPSGRKPTELEWNRLEFCTQTLFGELSETLRQKFISSEIPKWVPSISALFLILAVGSLGFAVLTTIAQGPRPLHLLAAYMGWLVALGSLGSIAFVGFNAIAISSDITFDINNTKLIVLRIILGALFALIFTLPFGFDGFRLFVVDMVVADQRKNADDSRLILDAALLLMPFLLGYSSSLAIAIISRFIEAIKAFFGIVEQKRVP